MDKRGFSLGNTNTWRRSIDIFSWKIVPLVFRINTILRYFFKNWWLSLRFIHSFEMVICLLSPSIVLRSNISFVKLFRSIDNNSIQFSILIQPNKLPDFVRISRIIRRFNPCFVSSNFLESIRLFFFLFFNSILIKVCPPFFRYSPRINFSFAFWTV